MREDVDFGSVKLRGGFFHVTFLVDDSQTLIQTPKVWCENYERLFCIRVLGVESRAERFQL